MADEFEVQRTHLLAVARRILGSVEDAEDAVQETWLRWTGTVSRDIHNPGGWLTTVTARICLDKLRARAAHPEDLLGAAEPPPAATENILDPADTAVLADSVQAALLVVLDTLTPGERVAFVLHDVFEWPFAEIAPIVGRTPNAAAQLASRARRRVRGTAPEPGTDLHAARRVADAFLLAAGTGDVDGLIALLDRDAVLRADAAATGATTMTLRGARGVADRAALFAANAARAVPVLVDDRPGFLVTPPGRPAVLLVFDVRADRIEGIDICADPARLRRSDLILLAT